MTTAPRPSSSTSRGGRNARHSAGPVVREGGTPGPGTSEPRIGEPAAVGFPDAEDAGERDPAGPAAAQQVISTAAGAVLTPVALARRALGASRGLGAKGGLPLYAGLGGLAVVGVIDWPVAIAAGAGYGLARWWGHQEHEDRPANRQRGG